MLVNVKLMFHFNLHRNQRIVFLMLLFIQSMHFKCCLLKSELISLFLLNVLILTKILFHIYPKIDYKILIPYQINKPFLQFIQ